MRLVDADAVLKGIEDLKKSPWFKDGENGPYHAEYLARKEAVEIVCACIKGEKSVDAEPVRHGTLLGMEYDGYADGVPIYDVWCCSVCGCEFEGEDVDYNYCPSCGTKLDGSDENERVV